MKMISRLIPLFLFVPTLSFAAAADFKGLKEFVDAIIGFINTTLIPAIFALGFLVFIWGMYKAFILGGSNEEKQGEGRQLMMYTIIGFVVMISLWGIVNLIHSGLNFDDNQIKPPTFDIKQ
jgi:hypothetical protein